MPNTALAEGLASFLPSEQIVSRESAQYDENRKVWNGTIDRHPEVIVRPRTTQQVANIVRFAASKDCLVAVRGGGHSIPGLSTCDGGIVLDLSCMKAITVDPVARIATVGGGALLGELDRAGEPYGLVTPAGVISHTGAGGLTLGGGMGWTSRRFGMTVDSLLMAEIVTADGNIIEASPTNEPELFWGLRGGGGNFGVVTQFKFRMHPLGKITSGSWVYARKDGPEILANFAAAAAKLPRNFTASLNATASCLSITCFHSGDDPNPEAVVLSFGKLGRAVEGGLSASSFVDFQSQHDHHMRWGRRIYNRGGFLGGITPNVAQTILDHTNTTPAPDCEIYVLQLGGAIKDLTEDATAYSGRDAEFYWIVQPIWDEADLDEACLDWGRKVARQMQSLSMERNYVNEQGDADVAIAKQAYGQTKYERLGRLKARFDPKNLFRLNQNITPLF